VRHAEALAPLLLAVVDVDADDHVGAREPQSLDDVEADAAQPEHHAFGARLHLGGVEDGADAGGDAAADVADLVEGRVLADLGHRDLGQHREVRERRGAHVVEQLLAVEREARGAVRHQALALGGADGGAQIGLAREARRTLPAFRRVERDDVVALLHAGHARPDVDDDAGALMAEDGGEQPFGVGAGERELVGVADAGRLDLDQHLAGFRPVELDLGDLERLGLLECDRGAGFHRGFPSSSLRLARADGRNARRQQWSRRGCKGKALQAPTRSLPTMAVGRCCGSCP
jgi:hypothetical protein